MAEKKQDKPGRKLTGKGFLAIVVIAVAFTLIMRTPLVYVLGGAFLLLLLVIGMIGLWKKPRGKGEHTEKRREELAAAPPEGAPAGGSLVEEDPDREVPEPPLPDVPLPPVVSLVRDDVIERLKRTEIEELDGIDDDTEANWLTVKEGCPILTALREYAAVKAALARRYAGRYDLYRTAFASRSASPYFLPEGRPDAWEERIYAGLKTYLRVSGEQVKEAFGPDRAELRRLCEENLVRLVEEKKDFRFRDLLLEIDYRLFVQRYPGLADDAATYGSIRVLAEPRNAAPAAPAAPLFLEVDDADMGLTGSVPYYEEPDGTEDHTGCAWLLLDEGTEVTAAAERLAALRTRVLEAYGKGEIRIPCAWGKRLRAVNMDEILMLGLASEAPLDALGDGRQAFLDKCRDSWRLHFYLSEDGGLRDISTGERLRFVYKSWPGSADDAATYGSVDLVREESPSGK